MNAEKDWTGVQIEMDIDTCRVTAIRYCGKNDEEVRSINRIFMDFYLTYFNRFNYDKSSTKGGRLRRKAWKPSATDMSQFHNLSILRGTGNPARLKKAWTPSGRQSINEID